MKLNELFEKLHETSNGNVEYETGLGSRQERRTVWDLRNIGYYSGKRQLLLRSTDDYTAFWNSFSKYVQPLLPEPSLKSCISEEASELYPGARTLKKKKIIKPPKNPIPAKFVNRGKKISRNSFPQYRSHAVHSCIQILVWTHLEYTLLLRNYSKVVLWASY